MTTFALQGPTIQLRLPQKNDAAALFQLASDPEVTKFFSWGPYTDIQQTHAYLERLPGQRERGEQLDLVIEHHEQGPIGITGLAEFSLRDRRAIVGTWVGRDWWGRGVNYESKALVAHLGFQILGLQRIGAPANVLNVRSCQALKRVGFQEEGTLRSWHRHGDTFHDVVIFGMLRTDTVAQRLLNVPVKVDGSPPAAFIADNT